MNLSRLSCFLPKWGGVICLLSFGGVLLSQPQVTSTLTPEQYITEVLVGAGIQVSNVTYTGVDVQLGHLQGFDVADFPIEEGLVLSCGSAVDLLPDAAGGCSDSDFVPGGIAGDADLESDGMFVMDDLGIQYGIFGPWEVNDVCILEFDFIAAGDSMSFDYIFASIEYPDAPGNPTGAWVNTEYNDAFGFYLSGPGINGPYQNNAVNIAGVPNATGGLYPITVSSVNGVLNSSYFVENTDNDPICPNGYTEVLTASYGGLTCGDTYHIKLAIGDGSDLALSSYVILGSETFESNAVVDIDLSIDVGADVVNIPPVMYEDCGEAVLVFTRPIETNLAVEEEIQISYTGTATPGVDYTALPTSVVFPIGVESVEYSLTAVLDNIPEGVESVQMEILNLAACNGGGLTSYFEFDINDTAIPLQVDGFNTSICLGDSVTLVPNITGGYGNFTFDWSCNPGEDTIAYNFVPSASGQFPCILTVSDTCGLAPVSADFNVDVQEHPPITIDLGPDVLLPCNGDALVSAVVAGGNPGPTGYTYTWLDQNGFPVAPWVTGSNINISTWMGLSQLTLEVEDECGLTESATINVAVDAPPIIASLNPAYSVDCNVPSTIVATANGGQTPLNYNWTQNFIPIGGFPATSSLTHSWNADAVVTLEIGDACGQVMQIQTDIVVVSPPVYATFNDTYIGPCTDQFVLTPTVTGGTPPFNYQWFQNFNPLAGGGDTYTYSTGLPASFVFQVTDDCSATATATTSVVIDNPPLQISLPDTVEASCVDLNLFEVDVLDGAGQYTYAWWVGGVPQMEVLPELEVQSFVTTPITVEVMDACGGEEEAQSLLVIPDIPMTLEVSNDTAVCRGSTVVLSAVAEGGEEGFTYDWSTIPEAESQAVVSVSPQNSVTHVVEVTDICGQTLTDFVTVEVQYVFSDFYTSYLSDTRIEFIANPNPPCIMCDFEWDFGDGAFSNEINPIHEYDGVYDYYAQLTVTNPLGCTDSAYTVIEGPVLIYIPSAFTPNNDGINDAFQIVATDLVEYELTIYNRWGDWVFQSTDPDEVWVGNVKGGDHFAPEGLYSYRLKWKGSRTDSEEMLGTFELMR